MTDAPRVALTFDAEHPDRPHHGDHTEWIVDELMRLDVRATWDWLSIHKNNPIAACGLTPPDSGRPAVLWVAIHELITSADVGRRQWNLFQMHFQLLMASQRDSGFDYLDVVTGPEPVHALVSRCQEDGPPPERVGEAGI